MFISICIPTYNEPGKIKKLLESISIQTYKDYEIIVTDDSTNELTRDVVVNDFKQLPLTYLKNQSPKGTPENWNYAISMAKGEWVKLMHHDDWFNDAGSLGVFAKYAVNACKGCGFIFCAYQNVHLNSNKIEKVFASSVNRFLLKKNPLILFKKNIVGNPSCTMVKKTVSATILFDKNLKWIVDFEYYIRLFNVSADVIYIKDILVNVGIHDKQVTAYTQLNPKVEIPEALYFLHVHGTDTLKNIFVYDYYWRLIRNLNIRSMEQFNLYIGEPCRVVSIERIIKQQSRIKDTALKIGPFSKLLMSISFFKNFSRN